ncbi:MAG TPA: ATP-binding protein [Patescibacteria group bacterium]|nr:ATP-binding protein [Patescibacteria group bacterium]
MEIKEIKIKDFKSEKFIKEKVKEISSLVGNGLAVNALSGGVDSSAVTILGHRALGNKLKTYFIDSGLMREGEPEHIVSLFKNLGVKVKLVDAQKNFLKKLRDITEPEEKREAITQTFYKDVFSKLVRESGAKYLLQGTNYTDVEETVAGIKRQHNVLQQLGIDTEKEYGYKVIEPLIQLRKPAIRKAAKALGLPKEIYARIPFPGPALAARVIGEVTSIRIEMVRKATKIIEEGLKNTKAFQYLAILHQDKVTGVKKGKREYGFQIELRCWNSQDGKTAEPTRVSYSVLERLSEKITGQVPGVVSVTYNITKKPPSTIEAI